ncbi:MAG: hypothetical protein OXL68_15325 [Paracoccaceae bacterium]|nr:hypothetical protein [Paracoccaceae bacterium]
MELHAGPGRTVAALDHGGREGLGAVKGDQGPVPEAAHAAQGALAVEVADHGDEAVVERLRWHAVERLADVVVTRDTLDSEHGAGVGIAAPVLEHALKGEKGRRMHEKTGECGHAGVADPNHQALPVRRSGKRSQAYSRMSRFRSNRLTDVQESRNRGG